jgi:hypothetical protein
MDSQSVTVQSVETILDRILHGFTIGGKNFPALTPNNCAVMLHQIGSMAFFGAKGLYKGFQRLNGAALLGAVDLRRVRTVPYSVNWDVKQCRDAAGNVKQSGSVGAFSANRAWMAAIGCFVVESQEFGCYAAGSELDLDRVRLSGRRAKDEPKRPGGKRHITELWEFNMGRLLELGAALIQRICMEDDGFEWYRPDHGWGFLANAWNQVLGFGSIFSPGHEDLEGHHLKCRPRTLAEAADDAMYEAHEHNEQFLAIHAEYESQIGYDRRYYSEMAPSEAVVARQLAAEIERAEKARDKAHQRANQLFYEAQLAEMDVEIYEYGESFLSPPVLATFNIFRNDW